EAAVPPAGGPQEVNPMGERAERSNTNDKKKERSEIWKFRIEVGGALILLVYTAFAGWQACEIRHSNEISRAALVDIQRSVLVFSQGMQMNSVAEASDVHKINRWQFRANVENTGTTPTRGAKAHINYFPAPYSFVLPDKFKFPDLGNGAPETPYLIGPRQTV